MSTSSQQATAQPAVAISPYYSEGRPSVIFYDLIENMYRPLAPEIAFYLTHAKGLSTPILEVGCGTGRIVWPLAEAGLDIVGLDNSGPMLMRAVKRAEQYPVDVQRHVELLMGDACAFSLAKKFGLILAPYRVFDHIVTDGGQRGFLANLRRHMDVGGTFIFDTTEPTDDDFALSLAAMPSFVIDMPHLGLSLERRVASREIFDKEQIIITDFCYTLKTQTGDVHSSNTDRLTVRWASPKQIKQMLETNGFRVVNQLDRFAPSLPERQGDHIWVARAV